MWTGRWCLFPWMGSQSLFGGSFVQSALLVLKRGGIESFVLFCARLLPLPPLPSYTIQGGGLNSLQNWTHPFLELPFSCSACPKGAEETFFGWLEKIYIVSKEQNFIFNLSKSPSSACLAPSCFPLWPCLFLMEILCGTDDFVNTEEWIETKTESQCKRKFELETARPGSKVTEQSHNCLVFITWQMLVDMNISRVFDRKVWVKN